MSSSPAAGRLSQRSAACNKLPVCARQRPRRRLLLLCLRDSPRRMRVLAQLRRLRPARSAAQGPPPGSGQTGAITISPQYAALAPGQKLQFTADNTGGAPGRMDGERSGGRKCHHRHGGCIRELHRSGFRLPKRKRTVTVALAASPQQNSATAAVSIILAGAGHLPRFTGNPQVAQYSIYLACARKGVGAVWQDHRLWAEHLAGCHAFSQWRAGATSTLPACWARPCITCAARSS